MLVLRSLALAGWQARCLSLNFSSSTLPSPANNGARVLTLDPEPCRVASSLLILGFFFFGIIILGLEWPSWSLVVLSICNDLSAMAMSLDTVGPKP